MISILASLFWNTLYNNIEIVFTLIYGDVLGLQTMWNERIGHIFMIKKVKGYGIRVPGPWLRRWVYRVAQKMATFLYALTLPKY